MRHSTPRFAAAAILALFALAGLATALPGCDSHSGSGGPTAPAIPPELELVPVSTTLDNPVFLASPPGDTHRLFIVEKTGRIKIIKDGTELPAPFLDLSGQVAGGFEQGLLSIAFDRSYPTNRRFYVCYTASDSNVRVVRYLASANPDFANPAPDRVLLDVRKPVDPGDTEVDPLHNGGGMAFGPDGYLWIGLGDGNGQTIDALGNGQSRGELFGSLLRIDVSGSGNYVVPGNNPWVNNAGVRPELWNYGLRNPWRWSFDRATGDLYIGDVGEAMSEEIDVATAIRSRGRGANYGWKILEGSDCVDTGCNPTGLTAPTLTYPHTEGDCVIGGYVYRGLAIPALKGTYFYGDFGRGWVRSFRLSGTRAVDLTDWPSLSAPMHITSFGEDANGELYVLYQEGTVCKIVAASAVAMARSAPARPLGAWHPQAIPRTTRPPATAAAR